MISGKPLSDRATELRTAYFRTRAGTLNCFDAAAWERVADVASGWVAVQGIDVVFWLPVRDEPLGWCSLCHDLIDAHAFDDHARLHGANTVAVASQIPEGR